MDRNSELNIGQTVVETPTTQHFIQNEVSRAVQIGLQKAERQEGEARYLQSYKLKLKNELQGAQRQTLFRVLYAAGVGAVAALLVWLVGKRRSDHEQQSSKRRGKNS